MTYHPEAPPVDEPREYDIGVFGATGFVGKLVAEYLCRNYASSGNVKFILAARSLARLEELKEQLCKQYGLDSQAVNIVAADVGDYSSLLRLSKACRVLVTTVGPFMLYGEPVARACVESRTHYCDISAEMPFVALLHSRHGGAAKERGVKLVSFCGFDSVPSDLCVYMLQKKAEEISGKPCSRVKMAVRSMRGGVSGATLATGLNLMGHSSMSDPYYLALHAVDSPPRDASQLPVQPRVCMLHRDPDFGYATFFVMSRVNENVVRWSNALLDYRYGRDFVYYEMLACAFNLLTAFLAMVATYLSLLFVGCPPTRYLGRVLRLIPKPGEGPSEHSRNSGYFTVEAVGRVAAAAATKQQQRQEQEGEVLLRARVASFQGDPGYKETAKMLVECALSLALEMEKCSTITGVVSPAAGIGDPLVSRLRNAGMQCEVTVETCSSSSSSYRAAQEEPVRHATKKR